ncbi:MAG TPA: hypothetical protein VI793_03260 [Anaerolineales bacterium]|nr:hypothetical protein [Anaerolineales bacterium]
METPNWTYCVPPRPDLLNALRKLRQAIFRQGEQSEPPEWYRFLAEREGVEKLREYLVVIYKDGAPEQVIFTGYSSD